MKNKDITTIRLKNSFEIITGYTFRVAVPETSKGNLFLLQAKNLTNDFFITEELLPRVSFDTSRTTAFVEYDDVVVSSRGNIQASIIESQREDILASSSVFILRSKSNRILSEYLAIYLNSSSGQQNISRFQMAGSIKSITKSDLEDLRIPAPSLEQQGEIIKLYKNVLKQKNLLSRKIEIQRNIMNGIINKFSK